MASGACSNIRVLPSTSVNRKVTTPTGSSGTCATLPDRHRLGRPAFSVRRGTAHDLRGSLSHSQAGDSSCSQHRVRGPNPMTIDGVRPNWQIRRTLSRTMASISAASDDACGNGTGGELLEVLPRRISQLVRAYAARLSDRLADCERVEVRLHDDRHQRRLCGCHVVPLTCREKPSCTNPTSSPRTVARSQPARLHQVAPTYRYVRGDDGF